MNSIIKRFCALALCALLVLSIAACGNGKTTDNPGSSSDPTATPGTTGEAPVDKTAITGKVTMASASWDVEADQKLVAEFNKIYPNIEVTIVPYEVDRNDYLTAQAAAQDLPDVIRSPYYEIPIDISQGWLYPLNEFVEKDEDFQYVNPVLYESFRYNERLYALPYNVGFTAMVLNKTLLESMNEDVPSYEEWTIEEFTRLVKKATTNTTSGISHVWNLDYFLPAQMNKDMVDGAYIPSAGKVDLTSGDWINSVNLIKELKSIPGLISDELWNQEIRDAGGQDDYEKKFGKDADAVVDGKVLVAFASSWDFWWTRNLPFEWDYYPLPFSAEVGFRSQTHADAAMMLATAKDPEAAFEWLKFITYGKDGTLTRLDFALNAVDAEGNPAPDYFIPATNHPDVVKKIDEIGFVKDGIRYMYNNMDKAVRGDSYRYIPGFNAATGPMMGDERQEIYDGKVEAAAVAAEMEEKVNAALKKAIDDFYAALPAIEAEFDALKNK